MPLGLLLFSVGCGHGIGNWYISEGWAEGPRKLQGHRALDQAQARRKEEGLAWEVVAFLEERAPEDEGIRGRARALLMQLRLLDGATVERVGQALRRLGG